MRAFLRLECTLYQGFLILKQKRWRPVCTTEHAVPYLSTHAPRILQGYASRCSWELDNVRSRTLPCHVSNNVCNILTTNLLVNYWEVLLSICCSSYFRQNPVVEVLALISSLSAAVPFCAVRFKCFAHLEVPLWRRCHSPTMDQF